jgi:hypothetical protein
MKRTIYVILATVVVAALAAPIAYAAPDPCTDPSDALCRLTHIGETTTPTPTPSTGGGHDSGLSGSSQLLMCVVLLVVAAIALRWFWQWRQANASAGEQAATDREREVLARGRQIATDHHAEQVQQAQEGGVEPPAAPPMADADLRRYADFGAVVAWTPGSAFAQVVTRDGDISRAAQAWTEACRLARLGDNDPETGVFTPAAVLVQVRNVNADPDAVVLVVEPSSYLIGEEQLNRATDFLVRTARVRSAGKFEREHASDRFTVRLGNVDVVAQAGDGPQGVDIWKW